jgi:hypothetical protein
MASIEGHMAAHKNIKHKKMIRNSIGMSVRRKRFIGETTYFVVKLPVVIALLLLLIVAAIVASPFPVVDVACKLFDRRFVSLNLE